MSQLSVRPFSPFTPPSEFSPFLGSVFNQFFGDSGTAVRTLPIDLVENKDHVVITANVPGVKIDQIDVEAIENEVSITVTPAKNDDEPEFSVRERPVVIHSKRVIRLSKPFKADGITAGLEDGVLTVTVPLVESPKPVKVKIASSEANKELHE